MKKPTPKSLTKAQIAKAINRYMDQFVANPHTRRHEWQKIADYCSDPRAYSRHCADTIFKLALDSPGSKDEVENNGLLVW